MGRGASYLQHMPSSFYSRGLGDHNIAIRSQIRSIEDYNDNNNCYYYYYYDYYDCYYYYYSSAPTTASKRACELFMSSCSPPHLNVHCLG